MREISLFNRVGKVLAVALVDDEDYEKLSQWKWGALISSYRKTIYARRYERTGIGTKRAIFMHKEVLNPSPGMMVDHRDRNTLNNQKTNLREATSSQNNANRVVQRNNKSGFKGVSFFSPGHLWQAQIRFERKNRHLGYFRSAKDAALAYNEAAKSIHGEFAVLNEVS